MRTGVQSAETEILGHGRSIPAGSGKPPDGRFGRQAADPRLRRRGASHDRAAGALAGGAGDFKGAQDPRSASRGDQPPAPRPSRSSVEGHPDPRRGAPTGRIGPVARGWRAPICPIVRSRFHVVTVSLEPRRFTRDHKPTWTRNADVAVGPPEVPATPHDSIRTAGALGLRGEPDAVAFSVGLAASLAASGSGSRRHRVRASRVRARRGERSVRGNRQVAACTAAIERAPHGEEPSVGAAKPSASMRRHSGPRPASWLGPAMFAQASLRPKRSQESPRCADGVLLSPPLQR